MFSISVWEKYVWVGQLLPFLALWKILKKFAVPIMAGPINGPAIIPVQQNWPSQNLAQPKLGQHECNRHVMD